MDHARRTNGIHDLMLREIFDKHGCLKGSMHSYERVYESVFGPIRTEPLTIIEIGVLNGASLASWLDYFPNAKLIGVDTFQRVPARNVRVLHHSRVEWIQHDSTTGTPDLPTADFVIDDGSHVKADQLATFQAFMPLARRAYFIEDVLPSDWTMTEFTGYTTKEHDLRGGRHERSFIIEIRA
jgi:hypothetical protein